MSRQPRVLVVDDSAFARSVLSRILATAGMDVVGIARDGTDALSKIAALDPDVVTLDLTMPGLDGIGVLRALGGRARPRVIVVSISGIDTERGLEALALGAVDIVEKPASVASERLNDLAGELVGKVSAITAAIDNAPRFVAHRMPSAPVGLVMIGTSTGGPQALTRLVTALPATLHVPVVIVLHIPAGYTAGLAARLNKLTTLEVIEGSEGVELRPGRVVLASGGAHFSIVRVAGVLRASQYSSRTTAFVPSIDEMFTSGAAVLGAGSLGVVLTGMGDDGLAGARAITEVGGGLLTESPQSCVVYGMPRCVFEAGLGAESVHLDDMAAAIAKRVNV